MNVACKLDHLSVAAILDCVMAGTLGSSTLIHACRKKKEEPPCEEALSSTSCDLFLPLIHLHI